LDHKSNVACIFEFPREPLWDSILEYRIFPLPLPLRKLEALEGERELLLGALKKEPKKREARAYCSNPAPPYQDP
jgi:hypothetical protein